MKPRILPNRCCTIVCSKSNEIIKQNTIFKNNALQTGWQRPLGVTFCTSTTSKYGQVFCNFSSEINKCKCLGPADISRFIDQTTEVLFFLFCQLHSFLHEKQFLAQLYNTFFYQTDIHKNNPYHQWIILLSSLGYFCFLTNCTNELTSLIFRQGESSYLPIQ